MEGPFLFAKPFALIVLEIQTYWTEYILIGLHKPLLTARVGAVSSMIAGECHA